MFVVSGFPVGFMNEIGENLTVSPIVPEPIVMVVVTVETL